MEAFWTVLTKFTHLNQSRSKRALLRMAIYTLECVATLLSLAIGIRARKSSARELKRTATNITAFLRMANTKAWARGAGRVVAMSANTGVVYSMDRESTSTVPWTPTSASSRMESTTEKGPGCSTDSITANSRNTKLMELACTLTRMGKHTTVTGYRTRNMEKDSR